MSAQPESTPEHSFNVALPPTPYPGLRAFNKDEWAIFFGREKMTDEVVERLIRFQLLVIHGDSGCGKSSLVRAGVLARLEQESARGGLTWRTCATQPRDAPLLLLAESLAALDGRAADEQRILEIRRVLNYGAEAPALLAQLLRRGDADYICILLDQFEELFAFAKRHGPDEATLFVQLLVGMLERPPSGLYVVVTMRSEFLGTCAQFPGLAEAVNRVQYLVPRMARTEMLRAVRDPAVLYGGRVSLELAERLILDAGGRQDELPLIQHGLAALYRRKAAENQDGWRLDLADYASTGGVSILLSTHADILCGETSDESTVERLFRALTHINAEGQAIRRPQTLGNLASAAGITVERLETVTKIFRREGASFLTPYGKDPIGPDTLIDISHEALIRCWTRLSDPKGGWLIREFEDGLIWRSLLVQADSFERDSSNILSPATARERSAWLESRNAAWAERYGGGWGRVAKLVHASVKAAEEAEEEERKRQKEIEERRLQELQAREKVRALRTFRRLSVALGVLLLLSVTFGYYAILQRQEARRGFKYTLEAVAEAKRQNELARAENSRAEEAQKKAEEEEKSAIQARKEAEKQRAIAEDQRKLADQQRERADRLSEVVLGSLISKVTGLSDDLALAFAKAPSDARDPAYSDISIRVQAKLKEHILPSLSAKPLLYQNIQSVSPVLVYACIPPSSSAVLDSTSLILNTNRGIYWDWPDVDLRRAMTYHLRTTACLKEELTRIKELLASESPLAQYSSFYDPSNIGLILSDAGNEFGDVLLESLLYFESKTVNGLFDATIKIASLRTMESVSVGTVNAAFSSFQANLDKATRDAKAQAFEKFCPGLMGDWSQPAGRGLSSAIKALLAEAAHALAEAERPGR